jgi:glycosyltransferase involved in cell wall biosynthesis
LRREIQGSAGWVRNVRVIALLATHNEERFIAGCIESLAQQGVYVYLLDNGSTDSTVAIASRYLGDTVLAVEPFPRSETFNLHAILRRKEELASTLDGDWFMHMDADEIRLPSAPHRTLAEGFADITRQGYDAVNFQEFTFIPTIESPDHDHGDFRRTMRSYYPFLPVFPHRLNAWRRQPDRVDLASLAGHRVQFPGLRMYPRSFNLLHYQFLSIAHAREKYSARRHDPAALARGWHGWREHFRPDAVRLPSAEELQTYWSEDRLDASHPRTRHYIAEYLE